jgi:hypothetical protein
MHLPEAKVKFSQRLIKNHAIKTHGGSGSIVNLVQYLTRKPVVLNRIPALSSFSPANRILKESITAPFSIQGHSHFRHYATQVAVKALLNKFRK